MKQPLVLLRIPRCGAGSVAKFLERIYGAENIVDRAEEQIQRVFLRLRPTLVTDCVIAEVPLVRWLHFEGSAEYQRCTMLRNPWARFVSHINHLAEIGPDAAGPVGSSRRALADEVAQADFTSRMGLQRFLNRLRRIDVSFDNMQVRMLVTGTMSAMVKQLTARDVEVAFRELERFAVIGFCEEQFAMQRALSRMVGEAVTPKAEYQGAGRGAVLSLRNAAAREIFAPLYELDQELYARARGLVAARQV